MTLVSEVSEVQPSHRTTERTYLSQFCRHLCSSSSTLRATCQPNSFSLHDEDHRRVRASVATLFAECGLIHVQKPTMPRQELALELKRELIQLFHGDVLYTYREVNLVTQFYVYSLEVVEAGLDAFQRRLCRKFLQTFNCSDILSLLLRGQCPPDRIKSGY
jgi:hypothetical protein